MTPTFVNSLKKALLCDFSQAAVVVVVVFVVVVVLVIVVDVVLFVVVVTVDVGPASTHDDPTQVQ